MVFGEKSIPIVGLLSWLNAFLVNLHRRLVLPTPESPALDLTTDDDYLQDKVELFVVHTE